MPQRKSDKRDQLFKRATFHCCRKSAFKLLAVKTSQICPYAEILSRGLCKLFIPAITITALRPSVSLSRVTPKRTLQILKHTINAADKLLPQTTSQCSRSALQIRLNSLLGNNVTILCDDLLFSRSESAGIIGVEDNSEATGGSLLAFA